MTLTFRNSIFVHLRWVECYAFVYTFIHGNLTVNCITSIILSSSDLSGNDQNLYSSCLKLNMVKTRNALQMSQFQFLWNKRIFRALPMDFMKFIVPHKLWWFQSICKKFTVGVTEQLCFFLRKVIVYANWMVYR